MPNFDQKLTAANIRYLLAIGQLDREGEGVRCVSVAEALGITKPSVHAMVDNLKRLGLLRKNRYGMIHLTEEGRALAGRYAAYYHTICTHFRPLLAQEEEVKSLAYAILAEIPGESIAVMCARIKETAHS